MEILNQLNSIWIFSGLVKSEPKLNGSKWDTVFNHTDSYELTHVNPSEDNPILALQIFFNPKENINEYVSGYSIYKEDGTPILEGEENFENFLKVLIKNI